MLLEAAVPSNIGRTLRSTLWQALAGIWLGLMLVATPALAQDASRPAYFERYDERPRIQDISPVPFDAGPDWEKIKAGQLATLAQLLEIYPKHEIYFLARDAEYIYDLAQLLVTDPEERKRLHPLNVSRISRESSDLRSYLEQEGISTESLKDGRKILLFDTGFNGTISNTIQQLFPKELRQRIQSHFIVSQAGGIPSTRVFLQELNPASVREEPVGMLKTIEAYEKMPRYTHRATEYAKIDDRWVPVTTVLEPDGLVSRETSLRYQQDIKASVLNPKTQRQFAQHRRQWNWIVRNVHKPELVERYLKKLIRISPSAGEAVARDIVDLAPIFFDVEISLTRLGLPFVPSTFNMMDQWEIAKLYPEWGEAISGHRGGFTKMLMAGERDALMKIMSLPLDASLVRAIAEACFETKSTEPHWPLAQEMFRMLLQSPKHRYLLTTDIFPRAYNSSQHQAIALLVDASIDQRDEQILRLLKDSWFMNGNASLRQCRAVFLDF
jgi:hypothetical protein